MPKTASRLKSFSHLLATFERIKRMQAGQLKSSQKGYALFDLAVQLVCGAQVQETWRNSGRDNNGWLYTEHYKALTVKLNGKLDDMAMY